MKRSTDADVTLLLLAVDDKLAKARKRTLDRKNEKAARAARSKRGPRTPRRSQIQPDDQ